jgi:sec-independent protein translocase protein TatA
VVGDILQPTHLLFVLVVALLVLGPKRLPEVGRALGKGLRDFRSAISGEERPESTIPPANDPAPPRAAVQSLAMDADTVQEPERLNQDDTTDSEPVADIASSEPTETAEPVTAAKSSSSS